MSSPNVVTLADLTDTDQMELVLSNMNGEGGNLANYQLVSRILKSVKFEKFNLVVLDNVFQSFITSLRYQPTYEREKKVFDDMGNNCQRKQPVLFDYDNFKWSGKLVWHKWLNSQDNQVWNTFSIKLPNNGYIYNQKYEEKDGSHQVLGEPHHICLKNVLDVALNFFSNDQISVKVFYLTNKSRLNIKVKNNTERAWLQITIEYGYPKQDCSHWYNKEDMKKLLKGESIRKS